MSYDNFLKYKVDDVETIEEFCNKYYKTSRYQERGNDYVNYVLESNKEELEKYKYCIITHKDSITGKNVSFYKNSISLKNKPLTKKVIDTFVDMDYNKPVFEKNVNNYKGFTLKDTFYSLFIGKYTMYGNIYSYGFHLDNEMSIICYCEGDIYVDVYNDKLVYDSDKKKSIEFYKNEA